MKGYTNQHELEKFLNISVGDIDIYPYIEAAEKFIDEYTKRNFKADDSESERYYDGDDTNELVIDDAVEVTKVEKGVDSYGGNFIEISKGGSDGYFLVPANYQAMNLPIRKIMLRGYLWTAGYQNHKITAKWGFTAEVPKDIQFVATLLSAGMYQHGRTGKVGGIKSESIGEYDVTFTTEQQITEFQKGIQILNSYKKYEL